MPVPAPLHQIRLSLNDTQKSLSRTIWHSPPLFPVTYCADRQAITCSELWLGQLQPGPQSLHVDRLVDNEARGLLARGIGKRLVGGLDHAAAELAH